MARLQEEYTDRKDVTHKVEHLIVSSDDKKSRDRIVEELFHALTRPSKRSPS